MEQRAMNAHDVAESLGICLVTAYKLMKRPDFPAVRIGKRIIVTQSALAKWLEQKQGKAQGVDA